MRETDIERVKIWKVREKAYRRGKKDRYVREKGKYKEGKTDVEGDKNDTEKERKRDEETKIFYTTYNEK